MTDRKEVPIRVRVPARFEKATLESLSKKSMSSVLRYASEMSANIKSGTGLLLGGPVGVGKTWALAALTRKYACRSSRPDYEFVTAPEMFENFSPFAESKTDDYRGQPWNRTYTKVPWLVINDLGKEYRGGNLAMQVPTVLGRILRARSESQLVTHITTNFTRDKMSTEYGESIISLVSEMTLAVQVDGPDQRRSG